MDGHWAPAQPEPGHQPVGQGIGGGRDQVGEPAHLRLHLAEVPGIRHLLAEQLPLVHAVVDDPCPQGLERPHMLEGQRRVVAVDRQHRLGGGQPAPKGVGEGGPGAGRPLPLASLDPGQQLSGGQLPHPLGQIGMGLGDAKLLDEYDLPAQRGEGLRQLAGPPPAA